MAESSSQILHSELTEEERLERTIRKRGTSAKNMNFAINPTGKSGSSSSIVQRSPTTPLKSPRGVNGVNGSSAVASSSVTPIAPVSPSSAAPASQTTENPAVHLIEPPKPVAEAPSASSPVLSSESTSAPPSAAPVVARELPPPDFLPPPAPPPSLASSAAPSEPNTEPSSLSSSATQVSPQAITTPPDSSHSHPPAPAPATTVTVTAPPSLDIPASSSASQTAPSASGVAEEEQPELRSEDTNSIILESIPPMPPSRAASVQHNTVAPTATINPKPPQRPSPRDPPPRPTPTVADAAPALSVSVASAPNRAASPESREKAREDLGRRLSRKGPPPLPPGASSRGSQVGIPGNSSSGNIVDGGASATSSSSSVPRNASNGSSGQYSEMPPSTRVYAPDHPLPPTPGKTISSPLIEKRQSDYIESTQPFIRPPVIDDASSVRGSRVTQTPDNESSVSSSKRAVSPAPVAQQPPSSTAAPTAEQQAQIRAQIEAQVRAEYEKKLKEEVKVKVEEELKKHDVSRWDGSADLKQLFDEVLADRDPEKRASWLTLLHDNELHTVAQLRALDPAKWERLHLPIGIEQALQDALKKKIATGKGAADEIKEEWKNLTATTSKGFKDLSNKISAAAKTKSTRSDKKEKEKGGNSSGKEK